MYVSPSDSRSSSTPHQPLISLRSIIIHILPFRRKMDFSIPTHMGPADSLFMDLVDLDLDRPRISTANTSSSAAKPVRKKFAVPPVKLACLECRASRTRCDGKTECTSVGIPLSLLLQIFDLCLVRNEGENMCLYPKSTWWL